VARALDHMSAAARARALGGGDPERLSGGDTSAVFRVGDRVVKVLADAPPGFFAAEARSLRRLAEAGATVPEVSEVHEDAIVLSYHPPGPPDWPALGRMVARLHRVPAPAFGTPEPLWLGRFGFDGGTRDDAVRFLVDLRLRPLLSATRRTLGAARAERVSRFLDASTADAGRSGGSTSEAAGPVVVHGDLWSGNVHHAASGPMLIDPSCQGADRAYDLAMMQLFGGFPRPFWDAYEAEAPVPPATRAALPAHELVFVLVHVAMFGSRYCGAVDRIVDGR